MYYIVIFIACLMTVDLVNKLVGEGQVEAMNWRSGAGVEAHKLAHAAAVTSYDVVGRLRSRWIHASL